MCCKMNSNHILLISNQRTGSSALASAMENKLGYVSKGEILLNVQDDFERINLISTLESEPDKKIIVLFKWDQILDCLSLPRNNSQIANFTTIQGSQHPLIKYLKGHHFRKFVLQRSPLETLVSSLIASNTGIWHKTGEFSEQLEPHIIGLSRAIGLNVGELIDYSNWVKITDALASNFVKKFNYEKLTYEDLYEKKKEIMFDIGDVRLQVSLKDSSLIKLANLENN